MYKSMSVVDVALFADLHGSKYSPKSFFLFKKTSWETGYYRRVGGPMLLQIIHKIRKVIVESLLQYITQVLLNDFSNTLIIH